MFDRFNPANGNTGVAFVAFDWLAEELDASDPLTLLSFSIIQPYAPLL
jgi:hypothetical protein